MSGCANVSPLPPQHNIVERKAKIRVGGNDLSHLNLKVNLLSIGLSLAFQVHHLQRRRKITFWMPLQGDLRALQMKSWICFILQTHRNPACVMQWWNNSNLVEANGEIKDWAIKRNHIPSNGAVIFHHAESHSHGFNVWAVECSIDWCYTGPFLSVSLYSWINMNNWFPLSDKIQNWMKEKRNSRKGYMVLVDRLILAPNWNVVWSHLNWITLRTGLLQWLSVQQQKTLSIIL